MRLKFEMNVTSGLRKLAEMAISGAVLGSILGGLAVSANATPWLALGPFGGDARTIAADPQNSTHLFLGTATGFVYESNDSGRNWKRLARVGKRDDLVLDHILISPTDSKHLLVGAWLVDKPDGGLYESRDGGLSWKGIAEMQGQSVRALAAAPSDPRILVAGTLSGVYRSMDGGTHWMLISPAGSTEIHEIESVAIDPNDPRKIFAGTWHLPWRTVDGGANWVNITEKDGIHDDSDIFSIIIDPQSPQTVYASACSGIYKSVNGGFRFERTRADQLGLDHMAIRTRKLSQAPSRPDIVFAGTTEGLWRTMDAGNHWARMTARDLIVNDIYIDPRDPNHVLIATDRAGVLVSENAGLSFEPSNVGFTARQVTSFAGNPNHPAVVYAGIVNDKDAGGVFMSLDGGVRWQQQSVGLGGRDVFSLAVTSDDTVLAGTAHGIFRFDAGSWMNTGMLTDVAAPVAKPVAKAVSTSAKGSAAKPRSVAAPKPVVAMPMVLDAEVYALTSAGNTVYAGTSRGLLQSLDSGHDWSMVTSLQMPETRLVSAQKAMVMVSSLRRISLSVDSGKTWDAVSLPGPVTQVSATAVDEIGNLWVGGPEGLYYSTDYGLTWKTLRNLYVTQVTGITFDPIGHEVLVTAGSTTLIFAAHLPDYKVTYFDSGWYLKFARPVGNHLIGATPFDGVVVQPVMVDSKVAE